MLVDVILVALVMCATPAYPEALILLEGLLVMMLLLRELARELQRCGGKNTTRRSLPR